MSAQRGRGGGHASLMTFSAPLRRSLEVPPSAGGRGHQVHKSWPISISDADGSLDPSSSPGEGTCPVAGGRGLGGLTVQPG